MDSDPSPTVARTLPSLRGISMRISSIPNDRCIELKERHARGVSWFLRFVIFFAGALVACVLSPLMTSSCLRQNGSRQVEAIDQSNEHLVIPSKAISLKRACHRTITRRGRGGSGLLRKSEESRKGGFSFGRMIVGGHLNRCRGGTTIPANDLAVNARGDNSASPKSDSTFYDEGILDRIKVVLYSKHGEDWTIPLQDYMQAAQEKYDSFEFKTVYVDNTEEESSGAAAAAASLPSNLTGTPTIVISSSSKVRHWFEGWQPSKITNVLEALHISMQNQVSELRRLQELVRSHDVMLFMKGDKIRPRCRFSSATVTILNESNINYTTFDILGDERVRSGLKKLSAWPTYPQLYVKGTLLGGYDVLKELYESRQLHAEIENALQSR